MIPNCLYCQKPVRYHVSLRGAVRWDAGSRRGKYAHSKCYIRSDDSAIEIRRALEPMLIALREIRKGV